MTAEAVLGEEQHLPVPHVGTERPSVRERDSRAFAPVLVVDLGAVAGGDRAHGCCSLRKRNRQGAPSCSCGVDRRRGTPQSATGPGWLFVADTGVPRRREGSQGAIVDGHDDVPARPRGVSDRLRAGEFIERRVAPVADPSPGAPDVRRTTGRRDERRHDEAASRSVGGGVTWPPCIATPQTDGIHSPTRCSPTRAPRRTSCSAGSRSRVDPRHCGCSSRGVRPPTRTRLTHRLGEGAPDA